MISAIGFVFAFFAGNVLSNEILTNMLEQNLLQLEDDKALTSLDISTSQTFGIKQFAPEPMSIEEMLGAYDTSLDTASVVLFFGFQMLVISF